MSYMPSAVVPAWHMLYRLLGEIPFTSIPENETGVAVWFGDPRLDTNEDADIPASNERVVLVPAVDTSRQEWGPIGQLAREETFAALIVVITSVPGRRAFDVADRLNELCTAVEAQVRQVLADGRQGYVAPEFVGYQRALISVQSITPIIVPSDIGWVGRSEIVIGCNFRVGTAPSTA